VPLNTASFLAYDVYITFFQISDVAAPLTSFWQIPPLPPNVEFFFDLPTGQRFRGFIEINK